MPTGYTAKVNDGTITTLRDYALECARGMGACISLRDAPRDTPIPRSLAPDTGYHDTALATAQARLDALLHMSAAERVDAAAAWNIENDAYRRKVIAETDIIRRRYDAMLDRVLAWEGAPDGLKPFMVEQLRSAIAFDVPADPTEFCPKPRTTEEWFAAELKSAAWQVEYHAKERAKKIVRTAERNAWLDQLWAALPEENGE